MNRYALVSALAAVVVALDQFTKWLVVESLAQNTGVAVISGLFNLVHYRNTGAAWGFLANAGWQMPLFIGIGTVALVFIAYLVKTAKEGQYLLLCGLGLIAGGAVGNLIDRIRLGEVVDFLDFYIGSMHWPAFNAADSALSVGVGAILLSMLLEGRHKRSWPEGSRGA